MGKYLGESQNNQTTTHYKNIKKAQDKTGGRAEKWRGGEGHNKGLLLGSLVDSIL